MAGRLSLLALGFLLTAGASAQDAEQFVPFAPGDRWVYAVEGVGTRYGSPADTVDATVEWRALDRRPAAEGDTLVFEVRRAHADGSRDATTCAAVRDDEWGYLLRAVFVDVSSEADGPCYTPGGVPISGNSYPFLHGPEAQGPATVDVGGQGVTAATAEGRWSYSTCGGPRCVDFYGTELVTTLAEGIGQVALYATYSHTSNTLPVRRDTIRARLLGADVGGTQYGTLRGTAAERGPEVAGPLRVGPNPAHTTATVWVEAPGSLTLLDALGREVWRRDAVRPGPIGLDVAGLPAGPYALRLSTADGVRQARIVVVR